MQSTEICNAQQTLCNGIAAVDSPAKAVVEVKNTGSYASNYTVAVGSCTHPVQPVTSVTVEVQPAGAVDAVLEVRSAILSMYLPTSEPQNRS